MRADRILERTGILSKGRQTDPSQFVFHPLRGEPDAEQLRRYEQGIAGAMPVTRALLFAMRDLVEKDIGGAFLILVHPDSYARNGASCAR